MANKKARVTKRVVDSIKAGELNWDSGISDNYEDGDEAGNAASIIGLELVQKVITTLEAGGR